MINLKECLERKKRISTANFNKQEKQKAMVLNQSPRYSSWKRDCNPIPSGCVWTMWIVLITTRLFTVQKQVEMESYVCSGFIFFPSTTIIFGNDLLTPTMSNPSNFVWGGELILKYLKFIPHEIKNHFLIIMFNKNNHLIQ